MLPDPAQAGESRGNNPRLVVVAVPRQVLDVDGGVRKRLAQVGLEFGDGHGHGTGPLRIPVRLRGPSFQRKGLSPPSRRLKLRPWPKRRGEGGMRWMVVAAALMLGGCNLVVTPSPLFSA